MEPTGTSRSMNPAQVATSVGSSRSIASTGARHRRRCSTSSACRQPGTARRVWVGASASSDTQPQFIPSGPGVNTTATKVRRSLCIHRSLRRIASSVLVTHIHEGRPSIGIGDMTRTSPGSAPADRARASAIRTASSASPTTATTPDGGRVGAGPVRSPTAATTCSNDMRGADIARRADPDRSPVGGTAGGSGT